MAPDPLQLQYFHVTTFRSIGTSMSTPGAALVAHGPLQYCQITSTGGITACYTIPWTAPTAILPNNLHGRQKIMLYYPCTVLATGPLQYFQLTSSSGIAACYTIPWTSLAPDPL